MQKINHLSFLRMLGIILLIFLILISCKEKGTEPPAFQPGNRDYIWTVDTLKAGPGDLIWTSEFWGSSPNDVWAVGGADASDIAKWHFDGTKWTRDSSRTSSNIDAIFGFSSNDIWISESPGSRIFHYDGQLWKLFGTYSLPGYKYLNMNNMWGRSPTDIYIVGGADSVDGVSYKGIIMHFNGSNWDFVKIPNIRIGFHLIRPDYAISNEYYILGTCFESTGDSVKIFKFDGKNLRLIYVGENGSMSFNLIGQDIFLRIQNIS